MAATNQNQSKKTSPQQKLEGEGSYSATRNYNQGLKRALQDPANIEAGANAARRAVEGPEGAELKRSEEIAKQGPKPHARKARDR